MAFKVGSKVRSKRSGAAGTVTEIIKVNKGHQIVPPLINQEGEYEQRTDLRIEYLDDAGNTAEALVHDTDAESA